MSTPELMKESQYTLRAQGNYDDIYSHVIAHIADKNGKLKKDQKTDGIIEASWRYGVNPFGLRLGISINKNQDETYTISVNGFFVDAIDTFGSARKKARNFVDQLINPIEIKVYTPPIPSNLDTTKTEHTEHTEQFEIFSRLENNFQLIKAYISQKKPIKIKGGFFRMFSWFMLVNIAVILSLTLTTAGAGIVVTPAVLILGSTVPFLSLFFQNGSQKNHIKLK